MYGLKNKITANAHVPSTQLMKENITHAFEAPE